MDCFCEKTWSHTLQFKIGYCQQCPDKVKWPAEFGEPPALYFNAVMFVFEPSISTYHDLLKTQSYPSYPICRAGLLNMYFRNIYRPIPLVYNLVLTMLWRHPENVELDKVEVIHYCAAGSKPWRYTGNEENTQREDIKILVPKWWDIYNDKSLDYKKPIAAADGDQAEPVNFQPFMDALTNAGAIHYVTALQLLNAQGEKDENCN